MLLLLRSNLDTAFGFAAFMMYLIYVADGESKNPLLLDLALGMMLPGMASGFIQSI
jgi:PAT family beta-lactamase induction signal transducer AmpG